MAKYLFDTNILLRLSDRISANYALARDATYILIDQGHKCCLTSQIIIEFWVVATRPTEVNGLGWTPERTKNQINQFLNRFTLLEENPEIFTLWFQSLHLNPQDRQSLVFRSPRQYIWPPRFRPFLPPD